VLSPEEARALDRLTLTPRSLVPVAAGIGARRARARGRGVEFHDFRRYQPGDDPRSIDWNVEARLRQLVVRVSRAEGQMPVHLLVDTSGSMSIGEPSKLATALRLAAAFTYVALLRRDPVGVATFDSEVRAVVPPATGRMQAQRVHDVLRNTRPGHASNLETALTAYGNLTHRTGLAIVLSDFFDPLGPFTALRYLLHRQLLPIVVQCLAPEDLTPTLTDGGVLELVDAEHPSGATVTVDRAAAAAYAEAMQHDTAALDDFCVAHGVPLVRVLSTDTYDRILDACVRAGILGTHH
jgi:uncharacterized protein (DUF58 family)